MMYIEVTIIREHAMKIINFKKKKNEVIKKRASNRNHIKLYL